MNTIPKPEFPRPDRQRDAWLNLNGSWDFKLFPEGDEKNEAAFAENRAAYDKKITVPFSWVAPLSGVAENVAGIGWYKTTARFATKERVFLCFGAVDYLAHVYVNGKLVGSHQGGYSEFDIDVTSVWQDGDNTIEVRAEDYRRETQTYGKQGYGNIQGIWQTVWLEERPAAYIQNWKTVTKMDGTVTFDVNTTAKDGATVEADFGGCKAQGIVNGGKAEIKLSIANPHLWSTDDPFLYDGTITLGGDIVHTYIGIREISTGFVEGRGYKWILLNGKPIYINGTLDQAFNPKGHFTYPTDQDMKNEAWRLKRLGLNMVRIHIKPEEPRKLYWMDKYGILVMEDIPCFWGAPVPEAKAAFENEMPEIILRDINHPATFAWVVFNETWGLFDGEHPNKVYKPETQEWVRGMYRKAKQLDPTRIVEDNSACNNDHVETDINTWHFYLNSYEIVRDHIRDVVKNTYPGSSYNFIGENKQTDAPLMNSECGMVWGVEESAGDSDLSWQYHYMLNEYRLHEKLCGFVFTEFHDVVNEFNGYYRIDDTDKDWGYESFCRGMSLKDLHAADFLATDCAPVQTLAGGDSVSIPLVLSSFSDAHHKEACFVSWELWHDAKEGRVSDSKGTFTLPAFGYGTTPLAPLTVTMPKENAVAVLSLYLKDAKGETISRNFVTFDVRAALPCNEMEIPVCEGKAEGFAPVWTALVNDKLCLGGSGEVSYDIALPEGKALNEMTIWMELGAKRVLKKDCKETDKEQGDHGFMRGYLVDRGSFKNSYFMTDESEFPTEVEVLVNGQWVATFRPANDYADARGVLSWNRQPDPRRLDEAASYGEECCVRVPSRLLPEIEANGKCVMTLRVKGNNGLAVYGRSCGRYAHGILVETH